MARPPRRVVLAPDEEPFILNIAALDLAPLFAAWPDAAYTVANIRSCHEQPTFSDEMALADVRAG